MQFGIIISSLHPFDVAGQKIGYRLISEVHINVLDAQTRPKKPYQKHSPIGELLHFKM